MVFHKKDKNGRNIRVEISVGRHVRNEVYLRLILVDNINFILFKLPYDEILYTTSDLLSNVSNWDCNRYEMWVDETIRRYNRELFKDEQNIKAIELIKNGC